MQRDNFVRLVSVLHVQDLTFSRQRSEALRMQLEGLLSAVSSKQDEEQTEKDLKKAVEEKTGHLDEIEKLRTELETLKEKHKKEGDDEEVG